MQLNQNNKPDNGKNKKTVQPTHRPHQCKNKFWKVTFIAGWNTSPEKNNLKTAVHVTQTEYK